jgi:hypothetical protein
LQVESVENVESELESVGGQIVSQNGTNKFGLYAKTLECYLGNSPSVPVLLDY